MTTAVSAPQHAADPKAPPPAGEPQVSASPGAAPVSTLDEIFERQRQARWQIPDLAARRRTLKRLVRWVEKNSKAIRQAGAADFNKPALEVDLTEIVPVLSEARFALKHLKGWMKPQKVKTVLALASTRAKLLYEPRGVVLIISPWNYPFNLTAGPLVSALAAGNRVILKPSESTPNTSAVLARMVQELFEPDEVALFEGEADVAQALLAKPFDHIFFTGSPAIGRHVMTAAAQHLTSVTLELGGKSPIIVDESAHLPDAVAKTLVGKWINAGQTCIAPDYALVERSTLPAFVGQMKKDLERAYGKTPEKRKRSKDLARIVNRRHFDRLSRLLDLSVEAGATVAFGGGRDPETCYFEPTVLVDVAADSPIMQEEIFGPILPVRAYDDLDSAIAEVRSRPKPLALYVMSRRARTIDHLLASTSAGGSCVNEVAVHFLHPRLPFGGVNHSGHGSAHGEYGFRAFSHERAVLSHHRFSPFKVLAPPYSWSARRLTQLTKRLL
ncbi:MAG: aldehyde dehydrogenase family protein [Acidobacteriota bacterium]